MSLHTNGAMTVGLNLNTQYYNNYRHTYLILLNRVPIKNIKYLSNHKLQ